MFHFLHHHFKTQLWTEHRPPPLPPSIIKQTGVFPVSMSLTLSAGGAPPSSARHYVDAGKSHEEGG